MNDNFEELWSNDSNWRYGFLYVCREDPRCIVPRRQKWMGKTLNFGHKTSISLFFGTMFILLILPFLATLGIFGNGPQWLVVELLLIIAAKIFYYRADIRS